MIPFTTGMPGEPIPYLLHTDWLITSILFLCMILTSLTLSKEKKIFTSAIEVIPCEPVALQHVR